VISYLDEYRGKFGVEPICRNLREAGVEIAPSTYYATKKRLPSARGQRDQELKAKIASAHEANRGVYGAVKMWHLLQQQGETVARCTVERLMGELGLAGAVRGKRRITTLQVKDAELAADLVQRKFEATAPDRLWVSDFTYVLARSGTLYTAFSIDVFSRRIVGWKVSRRMTTDLVLDTIEMALWVRGHSGSAIEKGLIHHSDRGSQYTSFAFTQRLLDAGVDASVGSAGDAYDNALAESTIGLYKTELIGRRSWRSFAELEYETAAWVHWYNTERLHSACGYRSPVAYEAAHQASQELSA